MKLRPVKSSYLCRASEHILHLAGLSHGVGLPPPIILTETPWDSLDWLGTSEPETSRKTMGKTMVSCRLSLKQIECSMKNHGFSYEIWGAPVVNLPQKKPIYPIVYLQISSELSFQWRWKVVVATIHPDEGFRISQNVTQFWCIPHSYRSILKKRRTFWGIPIMNPSWWYGFYQIQLWLLNSRD